MSKEIEDAIKTLKEAMIEDPYYAHAWHCNLAMAFYDAMDDNCIDENCKQIWRNEGASRFMKLAFGVDTEA